MEKQMSVEQILLDNWRVLPPEKQQEVLDFVEFLQLKSIPKRPRRSIKGLCSDLNIHITESDIAEARQELWGNFPREDI